MTSEGDILTALIALMKTEYEEGYRFYTKEEALRKFYLALFLLSLFFIQRRLFYRSFG